MKLKLLLLCLCFLGMFSCSDEITESIATLEISGPDTLTLNNESGFRNITISATDDWSVIVDAETDWLTYKINNEGVNSYLRLDIKANSDLSERWAIVTVKAGNLSEKFSICQFGSTPTIKKIPTRFNSFSFEPEEFMLQLISNIDVELSFVPDTVSWIVEREVKTGDTIKAWYKIDLNNSPIDRIAHIKMTQKNGTFSDSILIRQKSRSGDFEIVYPENLEKDILLKVANATASSERSGSEIGRSIDGDRTTGYHSNTPNTAENYFPITLEYNLSANYLDYLVYYPTTTGHNGMFEIVEILYKTRDNDEYISLGDIDFKGKNTPAKIDFPSRIENPESVKFIVKSGAGDGQGFVICREMEFYVKVDINTDLTDLFTDNTFSKLKPEITYEQIIAMEDEFYENIAKNLYMGTYPTDRVKEYEAYQDADYIAKRYKVNPYNRLDNATGISVKEGEELIVFCGDMTGNQISLSVMDWEKGYSSTDYMLVEGVNQLTMSTSGLVYVLYHDENPDNLPRVKIHIATGKLNGMFKLNENTDAEWDNILDKTVAKHIDLQGKNAHLVMPVAKLRAIVSQPSELLEIYDKIVYLQHELMGLFEFYIPIKNKMLFHSITDSYMYATDYRTAYNETTLAEILDVEQMRTGKSIWGPAHEVGHMHQMEPWLRWIGMAEVTNNIHALQVEQYFAKTTRLTTEKRYESAFNNIIGKKLALGDPNSVFLKLVPFWQLQLYATKVETSKKKFYLKFHQWARETPNPTDEDTKNGIAQLNFVQQTCRLLNLDLTEYFVDWGFLKPFDRVIDDYAEERLWITQEQVDAVKLEISKYPKPLLGGLKYINDSNTELFSNPRDVVKGTVSRSGTVITCSNWQNVVAFELWEGENIVLVNQSNTFETRIKINQNAPYLEVDWSKAVLKAVAADGTKIESEIQE